MMESNSRREEFTTKKDAKDEHKKDLRTRAEDTVTCIVKHENTEVKVGVSETCESGESDSDMEFLKKSLGLSKTTCTFTGKSKPKCKM